jgi:hypothetical protein
MNANYSKARHAEKACQAFFLSGKRFEDARSGEACLIKRSNKTVDV